MAQVSPLYFLQHLQAVSLSELEYKKASKTLSGITFSLPEVTEFNDSEGDWLAGARRVLSLGSGVGGSGVGGGGKALTGPDAARVSTDPANEEDYDKMMKLVGAFT